MKTNLDFACRVDLQFARGLTFLVAMMLCLLGVNSAVAQQSAGCAETASDQCFSSLTIGGSKLNLHYYFSKTGSNPTDLLIVMHGHPRDANRTFDAGMRAAEVSFKTASTLVVSPLFGVAPAESQRCSTDGVPSASDGDLLWTCQSWMEGAAAQNAASVTSFAAIDALIAALCLEHPSIHTVTFAGFSAGAQMVQHYIAFRGPAPNAVTVRFVVSDPGTWLYFDAVRPVFSSTSACDGSSSCNPGFAVPETASSCVGYDHWKYGVTGLPAIQESQALMLRARYVASDISYLEGSLDYGEGAKKAYRVLDRSCGANLQGPYRLQRGLAYAAYDREILAPSHPHPIAVVPGCAHEISCVFPSAEGRAALFRP
jgi:pimeloyl-ACP methyl ester carboxylesterase